MKVTLALLAAVLFSACSTASRQPDLAADERAIQELAARWQKALLERDAATQAAMFAEDGVSYHDGEEPLVRPAAILEWEKKAVITHPKAKITPTTKELGRRPVEVARDIAVNTAW